MTKGANGDVVDKFRKPPYLKEDKYYENLQRDRDWYVDALNAILVGAALITSITFSGVLQPPLQYPLSNRDPNPDIKYVAINRGDIHTFWVLNRLSFFFSMASALAGVTGVLSNVAVFNLQLVENIRRLLVHAATLLVISILFILAAFASVGLAVLPKVLQLQTNIIVTTVLGGSFCLYRLWKFVRLLTLLHLTICGDVMWIHSFVDFDLQQGICGDVVWIHSFVDFDLQQGICGDVVWIHSFVSFGPHYGGISWLLLYGGMVN